MMLTLLFGREMASSTLPCATSQVVSPRIFPFVSFFLSFLHSFIELLCGPGSVFVLGQSSDKIDKTLRSLGNLKLLRETVNKYINKKSGGWCDGQ